MVQEGFFVRKFFVTKQSLTSFESETRPELLKALQTIDPEQKRFVYASGITLKTDLADDLKNECIQRMSYEEDIAPEDLLNEVPSFVMPFLTNIDGPITRGQQAYLKESLDMLHAAQWTHNDIHIRNLMMGRDYMPRIVDFGLATPMRDPTDFAAQTVVDRSMLDNAFQRSLQPQRKRGRGF